MPSGNSPSPPLALYHRLGRRRRQFTINVTEQNVDPTWNTIELDVDRLMKAAQQRRPHGIRLASSRNGQGSSGKLSGLCAWLA